MLAVNTQLLIMHVTGRHTKLMQNYDYLNWARIMHGFQKRTSVEKCDEVIKIKCANVFFILAIFC